MNYIDSDDEGILEYYDYTNIKNIITYCVNNTGIKSVDISSYGQRISPGKGNPASFIVLYNGYLGIGEFDEEAIVIDGVGDLNFYNASELLKGNINIKHSINLPTKAQGITFYSVSGNSYAIITTSFGRKSNSKIYVYKNAGGQSLSLMELSHIKTIEMPCMIEESIVYGNYTYFVFESCGKKYRSNTDGNGYATYTIGQVCGFNNSFIFK